MSLKKNKNMTASMERLKERILLTFHDQMYILRFENQGTFAPMDF
jgi:hypothetical protein